MDKIRNCRIWKVKCGTTVIGPHVRPRDRSYYAVYRNPSVAGKVVNCVKEMWKVALSACYFNLPNMFTWKLLRNDTNKSYCCIWHETEHCTVIAHCWQNAVHARRRMLGMYLYQQHRKCLSASVFHLNIAGDLNYSFINRMIYYCLRTSFFNIRPMSNVQELNEILFST